jgi:hypothetical protein
MTRTRIRQTHTRVPTQVYKPVLCTTANNTSVVVDDVIITDRNTDSFNKCYRCTLVLQLLARKLWKSLKPLGRRVLICNNIFD